MAFALVNGQELFYEDSLGNGPPIMMMHGFLMDQSLFDSQVKELAPFYRCIRFDARAFGKTKWDGKAFSLYDTASDCVGLMDHLGLKSAVIVGMSQGGYAALRMALVSKERVRALVLMSTWAGVDDEAVKSQFRQLRDTWEKMGPLEPMLEGSATILLGPKLEPKMESIWNSWLPKWRSYSGNAIVHAINNLVDRDDISHRLSEIQQPALVTHGDADVGMPIELGRKLCESLPNCQGFVTIPKAAHAANYTHPESLTAPLLDFLSKFSP